MTTPTPFSESFAKLYRILAKLIHDVTTIERLCHDADLTTSKISFSGPVINTWYQVLLQTVKEEKVDKLRSITKEEVEQNSKLSKAWDDFIQALEQSNIEQEVLSPPSNDKANSYKNQPDQLKGHTTLTLVSGMLASALIAVIAIVFLRPDSREIPSAAPNTTASEITVPIVIPTYTSLASATNTLAGVVAPTKTPVPAPPIEESTLVLPTTTPAPTPMTASVNHHSCIEPENMELGIGWTSPPVFVLATNGAVRTFSHCPPSTTIQYDAIAVDDKLYKVELVCSDGTEDIRSLFDLFYVEGEKLVHYKSAVIDLGADCRIDFTVQDTEGGNVGLMIKGSSVPKTAP